MHSVVCIFVSFLFFNNNRDENTIIIEEVQCKNGKIKKLCVVIWGLHKWQWNEKNTKVNYNK